MSYELFLDFTQITGKPVLMPGNENEGRVRGRSKRVKANDPQFQKLIPTTIAFKHLLDLQIAYLAEPILPRVISRTLTIPLYLRQPSFSS